MSNINLNIPITFEAGAALQIKEDITQSVQNSYGMLTTFNQSATGFNMFLSYLDSTDEHYSGLSIDQNKIVLDAQYTYIKAPNGSMTEFFTTEDGKAKIKTQYITADNVEAKTLNTIGGKSTVNISAGIIKCQSSSNDSRIEFGIDENNNAVLKFWANGKELYNLGPDGIYRLNFVHDHPALTEIELHENVNSDMNISPTLSNYYLPIYKGAWTDDYAGNDEAFQISSDYSNILSGFNVPLRYCGVYTNLGSINGFSGCLISLPSDSNITYKKYKCGMKKVEDTLLIKYYIADENEDLLDDKPIQDGNVYNYSTSLSKTDIENTANYISDGYYVDFSSYEVDIDDSIIECPVYFPSDTYGLDTQLDIDGQISNTGYIQNNNYFGILIDAIDIREFTIYKYENGAKVSDYKGYIIVVYTQNDFTAVNNALNTDVFDNTYAGSSSYFKYYRFDMSSGLNEVSSLMNRYSDSTTVTGLLCSITGDIWPGTTSANSNYIEDYITWLNNHTNTYTEQE